MNNNTKIPTRALAWIAFFSAALAFAPQPRLFAQVGFGDYPSVGEVDLDTYDDPAPRKSFVLTRSDAIYEGVLQDRGPAYLLEFDGGGSTTISKLDTVYIGSSRASIFRFKQSQTHMEDVNEVLRLADWASRRQLGQEAIAALQKRLETSSDQGEAAAIKRKIEALKQTEAFRADAAKNYAQKAAADAAARKAQKQATTKVAEGPEAELEAWGRAVPAPTLERFSRKAQPILQKRCATAECHGSEHNSHYVLRPKVAGPAARLALYYNLRATVDYVDFNNIDESPILVNHPAVNDANGKRVYPFGEDRNSYKDAETFVKWAQSLPSEKVLAEHAKATKRVHNEPILREGAASRYDSIDRSRTPVAANDATVNARTNSRPQDDAPRADFTDLFDDANENETSAAQPTLKEGNNGSFGFGVSREAQKYMEKPEDDVNSEESVLQRGGFKPKKKYRDEYDPAIFNDKYHNDK